MIISKFIFSYLVSVTIQSGESWYGPQLSKTDKHHFTPEALSLKSRERWEVCRLYLSCFLLTYDLIISLVYLVNGLINEQFFSLVCLALLSWCWRRLGPKQRNSVTS